MPNAMVNAGPGVSLADIRKIEARLGLRFPKEFVKLYRKSNGGRPECRYYPIRDDFFGVHEFIPIVARTPHGDHFEKAYNDLVKETEGFPGHLVPFACDSSGDVFCFSVRDQDFGAIFCYVHECFNDPERMVEFMAPSLGVFLSGMRKFPK
jgi:hypothetical protein